MQSISQQLAAELSCPEVYVQNVISLIDEGNTIPFIARYRKEMHGSMDDTTLRKLEDRLKYLRSLESRKQEVLHSIEAQGKLTEELSAAIEAADTLAAVEDLYRPYKQKRRTKATIAKEKGLEPLALRLFAQEKGLSDPLEEASTFVNEELGVDSPEDALKGAADIVAEMISDDAEIRKVLKQAMWTQSELQVSAVNPEQDSVYRTYYEFSKPIARLQGHQILAINRGEREGFLSVKIAYDQNSMLTLVRKNTVIPGSAAMSFIRNAADDSFTRLISPSLERELRSSLTESADESAIHNFALNLRPLLMQPPVKGAVTMGLDPGYQHGCKIAVVDETGKVLDTTVVYPTFGDKKRMEAMRTLSLMIRKNKVTNLAIGNGTASRETEAMAAEMVKDLPGVGYAIVNEAGASVYSASPLAAEEFPDYDVNLRSAVSIARRLQDPLAELVKIDPKAIGVGQYQHDVSEKRLDEVLDTVVEDCVNAVGVDLNTASVPLLSRVSGLTGTTAKNIVKYREENGAFTSRRQLTKVPKLGPKAFEQCAGFLRIPESTNILDNTGIHPESYAVTEKILELCGYRKAEIRNGSFPDIEERFRKVEKEAPERCGAGLPTLNDIVKELAKPGRDPRDELPPVVLRKDVLEIKDLKPGMKLTGTVRNVIDFGVFVDIGVHQDGLVHISQVCDRFIKHPSEVVSVGDIVDVVVLDVDVGRKRISLSMKQAKS